MICVSIYLVIAPVIAYPDFGYLIAVIVILFGLVFYYPLVFRKIDWKPIGNNLIFSRIYMFWNSFLLSLRSNHKPNSYETIWFAEKQHQTLNLTYPRSTGLYILIS